MVSRRERPGGAASASWVRGPPRFSSAVGRRKGVSVRQANLRFGLRMLWTFRGIRRHAHVPGSEGRRAGRPDVMPRHQGELRGREVADPRGGGRAPEMRVHRCHHTLSRGPWVVASSQCPPPSGSQRPTNKPTIETFPKRAIYLLPINRSAGIKKSMWPGWASISLPGKGAFARARRTAERQPRLGTGVPGSYPRPRYLGTLARGGGAVAPLGLERWTPMRHASAPSLFSSSPWSWGRQRMRCGSEAFVAPRPAE